MDLINSGSDYKAHPSFVEELRRVSTALLRVEAAHSAELKKLESENIALRAQLPHLPNRVQEQEDISQYSREIKFSEIAEVLSLTEPPEPPERSSSIPTSATAWVDLSCTAGQSESVSEFHASPQSTEKTEKVCPRSLSFLLSRKPLSVRNMWFFSAEAVETSAPKPTFKIYYPDKNGGVPVGFRHQSRSMLAETKPSIVNAYTFASLFCSCKTLHPAGAVRIFWNLMCLLFITYDMIILPMHAFDVEESTGVRVCDWLVTLWWTLDMLMTFRTGYYVGARLEMRNNKIAANYARTWLLCDFVIITVEWISRFAQSLGSASILRSSRALRSMRFLRLARLPKIKALLEGMHDKLNSNVHILCGTLTVLSMVLVITIHVVSCIWYAFGTGVDDGWVAQEEKEYAGRKDMLFWYIASARWVISQFNGRTDVDKTRNLRERFFTCVVGVVLAVIAQAVFISFITKSMLDLSELVSGQTRLRRLLNEFLVANPLPPSLTYRMKRCLHEHHNMDTLERNEKAILEILPRHLQADVLCEIRTPLLTMHDFYHSILFESPPAMRVICQTVVQTVSARKGESVFQQGDACNRMLFTDKLTATYNKVLDDRHAYTATYSQISDDRRVQFHRDESMMIPYASERSQGSVSGMNLSESNLKSIPRDSWISEPALWTDWTNQGRFVTDMHGFLYGIKTEDLAQALKKYSQAFILASLYAHRFVEELESYETLSDILEFELLLVPPILLKVSVLSAHGLRNADSMFMGRSDPYCVCKVVQVLGTCSEMRFRTATVGNNLNPIWNYAAEVGLTCCQSLQFEVWDSDIPPKKDTLLGVAQLDNIEFCPNGFDGRLPLTGHEKAQGELRVKIEVMQLGPEDSWDMGAFLPPTHKGGAWVHTPTLGRHI